eukprot:366240-Chlamydomonas_euryale.AAC.6
MPPTLRRLRAHACRGRAHIYDIVGIGSAPQCRCWHCGTVALLHCCTVALWHCCIPAQHFVEIFNVAPGTLAPPNVAPHALLRHPMCSTPP